MLLFTIKIGTVIKRIKILLIIESQQEKANVFENDLVLPFDMHGLHSTPSSFANILLTLASLFLSSNASIWSNFNAAASCNPGKTWLLNGGHKLGETTVKQEYRTHYLALHIW